MLSLSLKHNNRLCSVTQERNVLHDFLQKVRLSFNGGFSFSLWVFFFIYIDVSTVSVLFTYKEEESRGLTKIFVKRSCCTYINITTRILHIFIIYKRLLLFFFYPVFELTWFLYYGPLLNFGVLVYFFWFSPFILLIMLFIVFMYERKDRRESKEFYVF